jgi:hypothetical protein
VLIVVVAFTKLPGFAEDAFPAYRKSCGEGEGAFAMLPYAKIP